MFNILLISKDKIGMWHHIQQLLFEPDATVMSELAMYRVGKHVATSSCITCKVLGTEGHDQLNTADNVVYIKFPSGSWKLGKIENV